MAFRTPTRRVYATATVVRTWENSSAAEPTIEVAVEPSADDKARWQALVQVLGGLQARLGQASENLEVILGDEFVRYAIVPLPELRLSGAELVGLAESLMRRTYGDAVRGWEIRLTTAGAKHVLAAAIEPALVQEIKALAGAKAKIAKIAPAFVEFAGKLGARNCHRSWVLTLEPACAVLALFDSSELVSLRVRRAPLASAADFSEMLERESRRTGSDVRDVLLTGEPLGNVELPAGWNFRGVPGDRKSDGALVAVEQH